MNKKLRVISLFDGISGARQALKELNIDCDYYSSEIDKYAIQVSKANHPDIIQMGDVRNIGGSVVDVDLLIGGFPCQSFSIAGNGKGLEDERGQLFFELLRILEQTKPKYFVFENVNSMTKENKKILSEYLKIDFVMINSALLTAQNRKRIYFVGEKQDDGSYKKVDIEQPVDKKIYLKDILESNVDEKYYINDKALANYTKNGKIKGFKTFNEKSNCLTASLHKGFGNDGCTVVRVGHFNSGGQGDRIYSVAGKSVCLSANGGGRGAKTGLYKIDLPDDDYTVRKLTPTECERLQGFPDGYTNCVSNTQAYKGLGNSFTVPVIKHILTTLIK